MIAGSPGKLIACSFGLSGFAVAIVAGLAVGNPSERILTVALASMFVCYLVGSGAGMISERIVEDYMSRYQNANPIEATGEGTSQKAGAPAGTS